MKYLGLLYFSFLLSFLSCAEQLLPTEDDNYNVQIFEEFWSYVNEHYIYFEVKGVDWLEVKERYLPMITSSMSEEALYNLCHAALSELKDSHNRIQAPGYYKRSYDVRENYDIQFSWEVIKGNYFSQELSQEGNVYSTILGENIGYIYIPAMNRYSSLSRTIRKMKDEGVKGLILDVRSNGGGDSNPLPKMLGDFVTEETLLGYYLEKSGPGHNDITEPLASIAIPSVDFHFGLPVRVLINRASYSATSYMAAMFQQIPDALIVGQKSGGGGGGNYGYQLSNEWIVAVSVSDFLDPSFITIEPGVDPDIRINNTEERLSLGIDDMLQKAIDTILE